MDQTTVGLNDAVLDGTNWKIVPQDITSDAVYEFYIQIASGVLTDFYTAPNKLFVGCPPEIVDIQVSGYSDPANTDIQYVDKDDSANTHFTLPQINVQVPAGAPHCSSFEAKPSLVSGTLDQGTAGQFLNDAVGSSSNWIVKPQTISTQTKYEFFVEISVGPNFVYTQMKTLFVGCPIEIVTITQGPYADATSHSDIQYVDMNDNDPSKPTMFVLPQFVVTSPSSFCSSI